MRTSRLSREAAQLFSSSVSPIIDSPVGRTTRHALKAFSHGASEGEEIVKESLNISDTCSAAAKSRTAEDIEDALTPSTSVSATTSKANIARKRKRGRDGTPSYTSGGYLTPKKSSTSTATITPSPRRSSRKAFEVKAEVDIEPDLVEDHQDESDAERLTASPGTTRSKAKPKIPARKIVAEDGSVTIHPPSNWSKIYSIVKEMREANPTAPVDTMGCEDLYWQTSPPREKRFHTLTALMLSSQTKDTVTAAAMQRLHTELLQTASGETNERVDAQDKTQNDIGPSQLTVANIIACDPKHLDSLIGKVGFHNNKTKYIKAAAIVLRDQYKGDIPSTIEGLVSLPGVGPKMAYLCMSAAWGIVEGIGVDVHVHRITNLWGWHKTKTPEETRAWLEGWLPKDKWHDINKMLVGLGQTVCLPVGRRCGECWLSGKGLCKSEVRGWKAKVKVEKKATVKQEEI